MGITFSDPTLSWNTALVHYNNSCSWSSVKSGMWRVLEVSASSQAMTYGAVLPLVEHPTQHSS